MALASVDIPKSLWCDDSLRVPPALLSAHLQDLTTRGLLEMARERGPGAIGGGTREEFEEHYATMFRGGTCRVCAVLLDPLGRLAEIPDGLQASLAGGDICIVDAPSGAATATLGLLAALLELRLQRKFTQLSQNIYVYAADLSSDALKTAEALLSELHPALAAVGINVTLKTRQWDATNATETATLAAWVTSDVPSVAAYLVLWESFSGATSSDKEHEAVLKFPDFSGSIAHLISVFAANKTTFLWIEPRTRGSKRLFGYLGELIHSLLRQSAPDKHEHEYHWFDTLKDRAHRCNVHVMRYLRGG